MPGAPCSLWPPAFSCTEVSAFTPRSLPASCFSQALCTVLGKQSVSSSWLLAHPVPVLPFCAPSGYSPGAAPAIRYLSQQDLAAAGHWGGKAALSEGSQTFLMLKEGESYNFRRRVKEMISCFSSCCSPPCSPSKVSFSALSSVTGNLGLVWPVPPLSRKALLSCHRSSLHADKAKSSSTCPGCRLH